MKKRFRFIYLPVDGFSIAEILSKEYYAIIGNADTFKIKSIRKDWGKGAKWGKYITEKAK